HQLILFDGAEPEIEGAALSGTARKGDKPPIIRQKFLNEAEAEASAWDASSGSLAPIKPGKNAGLIGLSNPFAAILHDADNPQAFRDRARQDQQVRRQGRSCDLTPCVQTDGPSIDANRTRCLGIFDCIADQISPDTGNIANLSAHIRPLG